jgi:peptidoglycan/LPS O-acetylase OafA/YrhL
VAEGKNRIACGIQTLIYPESAPISSAACYRSLQGDKPMRYIPALDGLRACAVLLVIFTHTRVLGLQNGVFGVEIFFVLSGFLITALLLQEKAETGGLNIAHFYARRLLRLYPPLLLFLLLYALAAHMLHLDFAKDLFIAGFYLTDYAVTFGFHTPGSLVNHTWSLAVEEQFYLIWPWALLWLNARFKGPRLAGVLLGLAVLATLWKVVPMALGVPWESVYYRFDTRLSGLLLGACLAARRRDGVAIPCLTVGLRVSGAALALCMFMMTTFAGSLYETVIADIFAFFLIARIVQDGNWTPARWLAAPVPVFIGRISYALYLFHYPIAIYARELIGWPFAFPVTLALAVPLSAFSYMTVERVARLKAQAFRRHPKAAVS